MKRENFAMPINCCQKKLSDRLDILTKNTRKNKDKYGCSEVGLCLQQVFIYSPFFSSTYLASAMTTPSFDVACARRSPVIKFLGCYSAGDSGS